MSSVRESFVERFGADQADAVERAAEMHENGVNSGKKGSDPFKWAIAIAIGYQCCEVDSYRESHEITAPWGEIQEWIKTDAGLASHDGDVDYITLFVGGYNEYMGESV